VTLYLDTSAVVKLYTSEPGSAQTRQAVSGADRVACSLLVYTETRTALARKYRLGEIDAAGFARSKDDFESDWQGMFILPVDAQAVRRAGELAEQFALRAYDAIHLAAALILSRETALPVRFICFDTALNRAASSFGLILV
jgi:uncharacterized protein